MTVLNIRYVNECQPGKKYGSVKTAEGIYYKLPAGLAGVFQPNTVVDVPTTVEKWKNRETGQPEDVFIISGRPGAAGSGALASPPPPPTPQGWTRPSANLPSPPPAGHNGQAELTGFAKELLITTSALMKSFIEAGKCDVQDLEKFQNICMDRAMSMIEAASK